MNKLLTDYRQCRNNLSFTDLDRASSSIQRAFRQAMGKSSRPNLSKLGNLPLLVWTEFERRKDAGLISLSNALSLDVACSYELFKQYSDEPLSLDDFALMLLNLMSTRRKLFRSSDGTVVIAYEPEDAHDILRIIAQRIDSTTAA